VVAAASPPPLSSSSLPSLPNATATTTGIIIDDEIG